MNPKIKDIIKNIIIGFVITVVSVIAFFAYYGMKYTPWVGLFGTIATLIFSKSFLLPFANIKIEGTIKKSKVKIFKNYALIGSRGTIGKAGPRTQLKAVVSVKTIQGFWFRKAFDIYDGENDLTVGTRIRFTIFDDRPEIIPRR